MRFFYLLFNGKMETAVREFTSLTLNSWDSVIDLFVRLTYDDQNKVFFGCLTCGIYLILGAKGLVNSLEQGVVELFKGFSKIVIKFHFLKNLQKLLTDRYL